MQPHASATMEVLMEIRAKLEMSCVNENLCAVHPIALNIKIDFAVSHVVVRIDVDY